MCVCVCVCVFISVYIIKIQVPLIYVYEKLVKACKTDISFFPSLVVAEKVEHSTRLDNPFSDIAASVV